jgi:hypothetical protein
MYLIFITPILEYASEVWDNCRQLNSERLERVQLEAVRVVIYIGLVWFIGFNATFNNISVKIHFF